MSNPIISILGCGWLGLPLGKKLAEKGFTVKGSTTTTEKLHQIEEAGILPYRLTLSPNLEGEHIKDFFQSDLLILNIPPGRRNPDVEQNFPQQVAAVLQAIARGTIKKLLFVSSTSIYGNNNAEVLESTPVQPETASGRALIKAEELIKSQSDLQSTILRMAGLAGGSREPGRFFAGRQELKDGNVPVNYVHLEDAIEVIYTIIEQDCWNETFNVCADQHPQKQHFYPARAQKTGLIPPTYTQSAPSPFKIVSNQKLKTQLEYTFKYADPMDFPVSS